MENYINKEEKRKIINNKRFNIIKIVSLILSLIIATYIVIKLFPLMINLSTSEGQLKFKQEVTGINAFFTLLFLQFAQIIFVVLPGEPLEILSGMYYGTINGLVFSLITCAISTVIIYYLTKKIGKPLIYGLFKKERVEKILNSKLFRNKSKVTTLMLILFLIPGTPKDLLTYIGFFLPINTITFFLIAVFGRIPSIISSTMAGATIASGKFHLTVVVYVVTTILTLIYIWIKTKKNKKQTEEIISTLKDE